MARTRVVRKTQRGTSIPELLVAMLVLLLGIWVVAAKFPKLTQIMRGERLRDQMARMAEQQLEKARDGVEWLPSQIAVYDPVAAGPQNVYGIDEALSPVYNAGDEPNWEDQTRPRNVVENTLLVLGETFRVPAPGPDATDPQAPYFLKCGPAELVWWVYQPIPLTRDDDLDPDTTETPLAGTFYAETGGTLRFVPPERDPQGNPFTPVIAAGLGGAVLEVSYAWVDGAGREHWMHGESVACQPVGPVTGPWTSAVLEGVASGGGIVPGSVTATFRSPYDVQNYTGVPVPTASPPIAALDQRYGQAIWLNASEQGKTLCVGYRLRTYANPADLSDPDIGRRIPLIRELHRVPDDPVDPLAGTYEVTLDHRKLEDEIPLFRVDLTGTALAPPYDQVHVLAFDTETGDLYTDADGTITVDYLAEGNVTSGWDEGRITVHTLPAPALPPAGRELVFYYRTLDREQVQLQRAPASFVEDIWSDRSVPLPGWAIGRWYYPTSDGTTYDPMSPTFDLPDCCLSQTVRVEYVGRAGRTVELHTVSGTPPATVTVNDPDVSGVAPTARIISVSGVSVKAFATWLDRGRLRTTSVEALLTSQLEPSLVKEPRATVSQP